MFFELQLITSSKKTKNNAVAYDYFDADKLQNISKNFREIDGYFYENAAVLDPLKICNKLLEGCDFYTRDVRELTFENGFYILEDIKAKNIILAQGVSNSLVEIPYMQISPIFGLRVDVKTTTNIHL